MEHLQADPDYDDADLAAVEAYYTTEATAWSQQWEPTAEDEAHVERYKRSTKWFRAQEEEIESKATVERERIEAWRCKRLQRVTGALRYLEHMLRLYSEHTGRKRHDSPNGVLKWVKGREHIEIIDETAFIAEHRGTDLVRVTEAPAKDAITRQIKSTGEIPIGADLVRADDTFKVEV